MTASLKQVTASKADLEREVAERKRAEEELRLQREWLRVTLSSIGDAVITSDTEGRITFLNPVAIALTGWQPEEAMGQPTQGIFRIINEKTHRPAEDLVARILNEKRVIELANDTALVTRDGREVPIEDNAAPILDAAGNLIGVVLVFHDVTEKRRAQEALQRSERRYRSFVDVTSQFAWVTDASGQVVVDIPALRDFTGQTYEEAKGAGWSAALHPEDLQRTLEVWNRAVSTKTMYEIEYRMRRHDGVYRLLLARGVPILNEQGNVVEWVGTCIDITERKHAEEALREAHARAAWLARFPEQNPNPVIQVSADGTILYCNPVTSRLSGWKCEVGQILQKELFSLVARAMTEGREIQEDIGLDGRFYVVWVVPFLGEGYVNVYGRDITQRKQAEQALHQRTLELQQLSETLEQKVQERTVELEAANVELRNQINECARVEGALKKSESDLRHLSLELLNAQEKERKMVAGEIHDSIGSSLSAIKFKVETALTEVADKSPETTAALKSVIPIVQGAIDEARRIQMNLRPSMLDDLGILATIKWFCRQFESTYSKIRISQSIQIEEHEVPGSLRTVVFRVLQEGLNNIAKHSMAKMVLLSLRRADQTIELVIQDNGQGFDLSKAHAPESTTQGLGLKSMRERIELSGGSFQIESTVGKGAIIRASWPI
jgi:PAS domain S-box-containing protein